MQPLRILIVEDKTLIAEAIAALLKKNGLHVLTTVPSGEEAVKQTALLHPDLVIMDIALEGALDGIAAAHLINEQQHTPIIYLSDFTDKATVDRAKKTFPANFLAKPFLETDLLRAIEIACYNANTRTSHPTAPAREDYVFLRVNNMEFIKLTYHEILYLKAARAYCHVVTAHKEYILSHDMSHIHAQLHPDRFIRIHRSYVVNLARITALNGNTIKVDTHELRLGDEYREDLLNRMTFLK